MRTIYLIGAAAFFASAIASGTIFAPRIATPIEALRLDDGSTTVELMQATDTLLLLVYRPSDLFTCASIVYAWQSRANNKHWSTRVALSHAPTPLEERALRRSRIHWVRVVNLGIDGEKWKSREVLFVNGHLVESSTFPNIGRNSAHRRLL